MKKMKLLRLKLENFKCHEHLDMVIDGDDLSVYGDNATGKSSVYDALTWLLFGKDSHGNGEKNIDIKPLDLNGNVKDHQAITSVEAILDVDGEEITLKRSLREVWTTKRGGVEATYDGNSTDYSVDGVPCKAFEYNRRVGEIVPEEIFRLLTSATYFGAELDWKKRRKALFDLAHISDDAAIMGLEEQYKPLSEAMGALTLDDLIKKLEAKKRGVSGIRNETPARIEECGKAISEIGTHDYAMLRERRGKLAEELSGINGKIASAQLAALADRNDRISSLNREIGELEIENREHRARQEILVSSSSRDAHEVKARLAALYRERDRLVMEQKRAQRDASNADAAVTSYRNEWVKVKAEAFSGGNCPACGQPLPIEQLTAATERFEAKQKDRLEKLVAAAEQHKALKASAEDRMESVKTRLSEVLTEIDGVEMPEEPKVTVTDLPGYMEKVNALMDKIEAVKREPEPDFPELGSRSAELTKEISDLDAILSTETVIKRNRRRIDDLREAERAATQELEQIEKLLWLAEDFIRYKTSYIEDNINGMFRLAKFRLFRKQANGGVEERCDVTYDGVPYISLNSGAKINVGVDVINTLSNCYGYSVPLVIDNAESVTALEFIPSQVIRLVVSESDKELRVEHEN